MRLFPVVIAFALTTSPVYAGDCSVFLGGKPDISVTNNMGASIMAGVVGGVVGYVVSQGVKSPNNSPNEVFLKEKLAQIDYYKVISQEDTDIRKNDEFRISGNLCDLRISLININLEYGSATSATFTVRVEKFVSGSVATDKNEHFSIRVPVEPFPNKPTRRFKADKSGKFVEVTKPTLSKEEAYNAFEEAYVAKVVKGFSRFVTMYK